MFSYYGSKSKIAKLYPEPRYDLIIEPFAGAASYSCLYSNKSVLLNESYDKIYNIWKWLISVATKEEILSYRDFYFGQDISELGVCDAHSDLVGFCINRGSSIPKKTIPKWSCQVASKPNWASTPYYNLGKIADGLDRIKHWNIRFGDYRDMDNVEATWFIDPPYQHGGKYYVKNDINYGELADWCLSRKGQVIVCENSGADWLDFKSLVEITGQKKKTTEVIWTI